MEQAQADRRDAKIAGFGELSGGVCGNVQIAGTGRVRGTMDALRVNVAGAGNFDDNLVCEELRVSGAAKFLRDVSCKSDLDVSGSCIVHGNLRAAWTVARGNIHVHGHMSGNRVEIKGGITAENGIEAELFEGRGRINVRGLLNAERVEISGDGNIDEIGCTYANIRPEQHLFFHKLSQIHIQSIEGDNLSLSNVQAHSVRGVDVLVDKGCRIDRLECTGTLRIHDSAWVGEVVRKEG